MDKFRQVRKTSTSPHHNLPATSASSAGVSASTSSAKFTIKQKVATGAVKKGPYSVKRSVDPNEVIIKRRFGEGSKPLFSRVDICVNRSVSPKKGITSRASSSDSSSPEDRNRHRANSSKSQIKKSKSVEEKVPYFINQQREKDRIKRVYGQSRRSRSLSHERRRRLDTVRSRSRTSPTYQRHRSYNERRSPSRDRYRPRYRPGYSRSRSRSRERRRISRSHRNGSVDERQHPPPPPATQFIPIPVPVEYPYMPPTWGAPMLPPQPRFPFLMRPQIPPPIAYMPRHHYRQPRYAPNAYQRGNFRPRQY